MVLQEFRHRLFLAVLLTQLVRRRHGTLGVSHYQLVNVFSSSSRLDVEAGLPKDAVNGSQHKKVSDNEISSKIQEAHLPKDAANGSLDKEAGNSEEMIFHQFHELCNRHFSGDMTGSEGVPPHSMHLHKVYILVISAITGRRTPIMHCAAPSSGANLSEIVHESYSKKLRAYSQTAQEFRNIGKFKTGAKELDCIPSDKGGCGLSDISENDVARMIALGVFLGNRYREFPGLVGEATVAGVPLAWATADVAAFQSMFALLYGMLPDKLFMTCSVRKFNRHVVRGAGDYSWCDSVSNIEPFMVQSYEAEREIFKSSHHHHASSGPETRAKRLLQAMFNCRCDAKRSISGNGNDNLSTSFKQVLDSVSKHNTYLLVSTLFRAYAVSDLYLYVQDLLTWFEMLGNSANVRVDGVSEFFFLKVMAVLGYRNPGPLLPGCRLVVEQYRKSVSHNDGMEYWRFLVNGRVVSGEVGLCAGLLSHAFCSLDTVLTRWKALVSENRFSVCNDWNASS